MEVLSVNNLCKSFGQKQVLKDVSFSVNKGEVVGIIGKSGGGKTTTLRCINLLEMPDSGFIRVGNSVMFDGRPGMMPNSQQIHEARLKIGLVFQNFNLFPQYNVLNNILLAPRTLYPNIPHSYFAKKARQIIERMGLSDRIHAYPSQLSGGQQQRVAIARALILEPELLCFDEPTSALDPELTGEVVKIIRDLKDAGTTMVIVTHEMEFARQVADRMIFFADGIIEETGTPDELFNNPKSEKLKTFIQS